MSRSCSFVFLGIVEKLIYAFKRIVARALAVFMYSSAGNFASFFEVGVGIYLDRRVRISWIIPVLLVSFVFNVFICSKAFFDLVLSRIAGRKMHDWAKTAHAGGITQCS